MWVGRQRRDRVGDRSTAGASRAEGPHPVAFLGDVDELEIGREGSNHAVEVIRRERADDRHDALTSRRRRGGAKGDRRLSQPLDVIEERVAGTLGDSASEQRREKADVASERLGQRPLPAARRFGR
jgi:hypothetical protein